MHHGDNNQHFCIFASWWYQSAFLQHQRIFSSGFTMVAISLWWKSRWYWSLWCLVPSAKEHGGNFLSFEIMMISKPAGELNWDNGEWPSRLLISFVLHWSHFICKLSLLLCGRLQENILKKWGKSWASTIYELAVGTLCKCVSDTLYHDTDQEKARSSSGYNISTLT